MNDHYLEESPQLVSLDTLGTDVLCLICDLLLETSSPSLSSLAFTSRTLWSIARRSQHREVGLNADREDGRHAQRRLAYMETCALYPSIRHLKIYGNRPVDQDFVKTMCSSIPQMRGLRHLYLTPRLFKREILEMVEKLDNVSLHVQLTDAIGGLAQVGQWLDDLTGCQSLTSLYVAAEYTDAQECLSITKPLRQLWLTCKNLRDLTINIGMPSSGCCIYDPPDKYCGFGFVEGERPAALEKLNIIEYPWGQDEREFWANHLNWSRLKRVNFDSPGLGAILVPHLPALEEVSFASEHDWSLAVDEMQHTKTKLHSLTLPRLDVLTIAKVPNLGPQLRTLSAHTYEDNLAWKILATEADASFNELVKLCPSLETLEIDLHRNGSWPYKKLEKLASGLPRLRDLSIWFALGGSDAPIEPKVTLEVVAEIFRLLKQHSRSLEKVTIHSGAPSPMGLGYPSGEAFWPGYMSVEFICEMAERDDERLANRFYIACKGIRDWRVRDDQLQEHITRYREESDSVDFFSSQRLKAAVEGPVPYSQADMDCYM